jgi:hypothetical protein
MSIDAEGRVLPPDAPPEAALVSFPYKRVHCVPGMCVEKTSGELIDDVKRAIAEKALEKGFQAVFV